MEGSPPAPTIQVFNSAPPTFNLSPYAILFSLKKQEIVSFRGVLSSVSCLHPTQGLAAASCPLDCLQPTTPNPLLTNPGSAGWHPCAPNTSPCSGQLFGPDPAQIIFNLLQLWLWQN